MEKLIEDFSLGLALCQLLNITLVVLFIYVIVKVIKYINARQKMLNK